MATIELSDRTGHLLDDIARRTRQTAEQVLQHALAEYERSLLWSAYASASDAVASDGGALADEARERALWDVTTRDGIDEV